MSEDVQIEEEYQDALDYLLFVLKVTKKIIEENKYSDFTVGIEDLDHAIKRIALKFRATRTISEEQKSISKLIINEFIASLDSEKIYNARGEAISILKALEEEEKKVLYVSEEVSQEIVDKVWNKLRVLFSIFSLLYFDHKTWSIFKIYDKTISTLNSLNSDLKESYTKMKNEAEAEIRNERDKFEEDIKKHAEDIREISKSFQDAVTEDSEHEAKKAFEKEKNDSQKFYKNWGYCTIMSILFALIIMLWLFFGTDTRFIKISQIKVWQIPPIFLALSSLIGFCTYKTTFYKNLYKKNSMLYNYFGMFSKFNHELEKEDRKELRAEITRILFKNISANNSEKN